MKLFLFKINETIYFTSWW